MEAFERERPRKFLTNRPLSKIGGETTIKKNREPSDQIDRGSIYFPFLFFIANENRLEYGVINRRKLFAQNENRRLRFHCFVHDDETLSC